VKNCQAAEQLPPGDTQELALLAWSMVHGIAKLAITGRLPYSSRPAILKFAEFVMSASLPVPNK
jgi:Tetracyclin repressor-like, C-terminal domain